MESAFAILGQGHATGHIGICASEQFPYLSRRSGLQWLPREDRKVSCELTHLLIGLNELVVLTRL